MPPTNKINHNVTRIINTKCLLNIYKKPIKDFNYNTKKNMNRLKNILSTLKATIITKKHE